MLARGRHARLMPSVYAFDHNRPPQRGVSRDPGTRTMGDGVGLAGLIAHTCSRPHPERDDRSPRPGPPPPSPARRPPAPGTATIREVHAPRKGARKIRGPRSYATACARTVCGCTSTEPRSISRRRAADGREPAAGYTRRPRVGHRWARSTIPSAEKPTGRASPRRSFCPTNWTARLSARWNSSSASMRTGPTPTTGWSPPIGPSASRALHVGAAHGTRLYPRGKASIAGA